MLIYFVYFILGQAHQWSGVTLDFVFQDLSLRCWRTIHGVGNQTQVSCMADKCLNPTTSPFPNYSLRKTKKIERGKYFFYKIIKPNDLSFRVNR